MREMQAIEAAKREEDTINDLEQLIREESLKNQARENELEDQHQNKKYLKKKEALKKDGKQKMGFDTSTAVNSKRKSRNI